MSPQPADQDHQRQRAAVSAAAGRAARAVWAEADPEDLVRSWSALVARVVALITAGQAAAARQADPYLQQALLGEDAEGEVNADRLTGVTGDGRDLADLLMMPVYVALNRIGRGFSTALSIASGAAFLEMLTRTLVADAGRAADLVGMIARPAVTSYVRVVELPACARCILLAGAEYGISTGFQRHPRCDCTMAPVTRTHRPEPVDAADVFRQMTEQQRVKAFGRAAVEAIEAGADIGQVVNARRGMSTATAYSRDVQATTEGITRRGIAGRRLRNFEERRAPGQRYRRSRTPRLMPEEILRLADGDREHAVRLLKKHAYIV